MFATVLKWTKKNRIWLLPLAVMVVFVTTYMLILPALTLEKDVAEQQGGIDVTSIEEAADLSFEGDGYSISAAYDTKAGLPQGTELAVSEIDEGTDDYDALREEALKAVQAEDEGSGIEDLEFAYFYDISLMADGAAVEPEAPVDVSISYDKALEVSDADKVRIVHFAANEDGEIEPEVLDAGQISLEMKKDRLKGAGFEAESFSVYAVVYTVDFHYEVDGETYEFSMEGEDAISLMNLAETLHLNENENGSEISVEQFMTDIESVDFSTPEFLAVVKVEEDTTLGKLKAENDISQDFAAWKEQGEVERRNGQKFSAGDWALISLKPFSTEEKLTITMESGEQVEIIVTDAQDATMNGDKVQTIPNPSGTTIDLFNYWVDDKLKNNSGRSAWPGYEDGWTYKDDNNYEWYKTAKLLGTGNDAGINEGHMFKFSPAWAGTVYDGTIPNKEDSSLLSPTRNPTNVSYTNDGDRLYYTGGVNSYTGNGDPRQGLVESTLSGGYPKLTENASLGTDGESLSYLFERSNGNYRDYYGGVNQLMYVDKDGYYTYDSRDYKAELNSDGKTFTVTEQTSEDSEVRGFWPFGQQKFWVGMHMNTQFSMPANGQVLNPKEEMKDMQFEFSGDDDTWLYVDGVLIGDGGGVHNRTEIDINFATGKVTVTGKKDSNHTGNFEETKWLDEIFKAAGRYKDADWEEIPGTNHKRFKAGTYHTFDMFYLERGGGESNLYIHYNLVSTEDFTGHKSYEGFADDERMSRDQFKFELIGLDGQYQSVLNEGTQTATVTKLNDTGHAIMPTTGTAGGKGTFEDPKKEYSSSAWTDSEGNVYGGNVLTTGVTENGDIRFGTAEITQTEMNNCDQGHPSLYRYIMREVIPDDAVNADGVRWDEATDVQKAAGGFVKDQVKYDNKIYYMTAQVTSWNQTGADGNTYKAYGLKKTYYTDDTFTTVDDSVNFVDFRNRYAPDSGNIEFTKVDGTNNPLPGAEFTLYTDKACTKVAKDLGSGESGAGGTDQVKTSGIDGKVAFENLAAPRTYYMKETTVPDGYEANDTVYTVIIEDSKDTTKKSRIVVGDDQTEINKIVNMKPGELSVIKEWQNQNGEAIDAGSREARIKLKRRIASIEKVNLTINIKTDWQENEKYGECSETFVVDKDSAIVKWKDKGQFGWDASRIKTIATSPASVEVTDQTTHGGGNNPTFKISGLKADVENITIEFTYTKGPYNTNWFVEEISDKASIEVTPTGDIDLAEEPVEDTEFNGENHVYTFDGETASRTWKIGGNDSNYETGGFDYPTRSDAGKIYKYYVAELDGDGNELIIDADTALSYTLKGYSNNNSTGVADQGTLKVYNQIKETDNKITVQKKWLDRNGNDLSNHPDKIKFDVYQLKHEHVWTPTDNKLDPTEDEEGWAEYECSCGGTKRITIPKLAHVHDLEHVAAVEATCTEAGNVEYWHCKKSNCGLNYSDSEGENLLPEVSVPALGHDFSVEQTITATCEEAGEGVYKCSRCDATETRSVPALGHDWGEWTDNQNGTETRTCGRNPSHTETRQKCELYKDTRIILQENVWPEGAANLTPGGVFKYQNDYWVIVKAQSLNAEQVSSGPSLVESWGVTVKLNEIVAEAATLYPNNGNTQANVQKGTVVIGTDGNYYVRTKNDSWSSPPKATDKPDSDGWYLIPSSTYADITSATNGGKSLSKKFRRLKAPAARNFIANMTEQQLISYIDVTALGEEGKKNNNTLTKVTQTPVEMDTSGNGPWEKTVTFKTQDDPDVVYTYYVLETDPASGWLTTYEGQNSGLTDGGKVTISNQEISADTGITIRKVDKKDVGNDEAKLLKGASFTITKYTDNTFKVIDEDDPWSQTLKDEREGDSYTLNGIFTFSNLPVGFYRVSEAVMPEGYVQSGEDPAFEVRENSETGDIEIALFTKNEDKYVEVPSGSTEMVRLTANGTMYVGNTPGSALPNSGGPGTTWIYLIGAILLLGCGTILVARRRTRRA